MRRAATCASLTDMVYLKEIRNDGGRSEFEKMILVEVVSGWKLTGVYQSERGNDGGRVFLKEENMILVEQVLG